MYAAIVFPDESVGIPAASISTLIFSASRAIGESTVVGYVKAVPQELICTYGTGTGLGDLFQTLTTLMILNYGLESMEYTMILAFLILPYFFFFLYFE